MRPNLTHGASKRDRRGLALDLASQGLQSAPIARLEHDALPFVHRYAKVQSDIDRQRLAGLDIELKLEAFCAAIFVDQDGIAWPHNAKRSEAQSNIRAVSDDNAQSEAPLCRPRDAKGGNFDGRLDSLAPLPPLPSQKTYRHSRGHRRYEFGNLGNRHPSIISQFGCARRSAIVALRQSGLYAVPHLNDDARRIGRPYTVERNRFRIVEDRFNEIARDRFALGRTHQRAYQARHRYDMRGAARYALRRAGSLRLKQSVCGEGDNRVVVHGCAP